MASLPLQSCTSKPVCAGSGVGHHMISESGPKPQVLDYLWEQFAGDRLCCHSEKELEGLPRWELPSVVTVMAIQAPC
jgi:hypothetical protein